MRVREELLALVRSWQASAVMLPQADRIRVENMAAELCELASGVPSGELIAVECTSRNADGIKCKLHNGHDGQHEAHQTWEG